MRQSAYQSAAARNLSSIWKRKYLLGLGVLCLFSGAGILRSQSFWGPPSLSVTITGSKLFDAYGSPTEALVTKNGFVLVSISANGGPGTGIQVFQPFGGSYVNPCTQSPRQIIRFPQPIPGQNVQSVQGIKFFPASASPGIGVGAAVERFGADFARITNLTTCAIDGTVNVPQREVIVPHQCKEPFCSPGSFDLAFTPNGLNAFIANEYGQLPKTPPPPEIHGAGTIGVVKVVRDSVGRFTSETKPIPVNPYLYVLGGRALPGITISNDGKWLFVTSEGTSENRFQNPTRISTSNPNYYVQVNGNCNSTGARNGLLTIVDVQKAINGHGQNAIKRRIASGCEPVRIVQTANGALIWVAVRGDNRVLAFDVQKLLSDQDIVANTALVGYADTGGTAPVGMALFHNDQLLAVANSNRFNNPWGLNNVAILDVRDPTAASVLTSVPSAYTNEGTSGFPRDVTVGNDGSTLFVPNTDAKKLQVITTVAVP